MTRVVAQGTFDVLHPGHLHYLEEAAALGDSLHVIVARDRNVTHKQNPVLSEDQRREMVAALAVVDEARLGHAEDFFVPIRDIEPDVIVLGHDQHHDEATIEGMLAEEGFECRVTRASPRAGHDDAVLSTGRIIERICEERC